MVYDEIHVHAITGSKVPVKPPLGQLTSVTGTTISQSINPLNQHLEEIAKVIRTLAGKDIRVNFVPMRGDFTRGILPTSTRCELSAEEISEVFGTITKFSFVHISDAPISLKEVVNTNKALLHIASYDGYLISPL